MKDYHISCTKVISKIKGENIIYSAILEVEHEAFTEILKKGKINVGWDRCNAFDGQNVRRCYKCLGYNHKAAKCTKKLRCARCLGEHKSENCTNRNERFTCGNCVDANEELGLQLDTNHSIFSKTCPVYLRKLKVEKERVGF